MYVPKIGGATYRHNLLQMRSIYAVEYDIQQIKNILIVIEALLGPMCI